jgi:hypothetical protein
MENLRELYANGTLKFPKQLLYLTRTLISWMCVNKTMASEKIIICGFWRIILYLPLLILAVLPEETGLGFFPTTVVVLILLIFLYFFKFRLNPQFTAMKMGDKRMVFENMRGISGAIMISPLALVKEQPDFFLITYIFLVVMFELVHFRVRIDSVQKSEIL